MNKVFRNLFYFLLFISSISFSQTNNNVATSEDSVNTVVKLEISEIPDFIRNTSARISEIMEKFETEYTINTIRVDLNDYVDEFDSLKISTEKLELDILSYVKIKDLEFYWQETEKKLIKNESLVNGFSKKISSVTDEISPLLDLNTRLTIVAEEEKTSELLIKNLDDIRIKLDTLKSKLAFSSDEIFNFLGLISDHGIYISSLKQKIEEILTTRKGKIFTKDSEEFWLIFSDFSLDNVTTDIPNNVVGSYHISIDDFYSQYNDQFFFHLIAFILMVIAIVYLKKLLNNIELTEEENNSLTKVLKRPLEVAMLFYVMFIAFGYESLPWVIRFSLVGLLIISLIRILFTIIHVKLRIPLIIFSILYFCQQLVAIFGGGSILERTSLLILPIFLILLLNIFNNKKNLFARYNSKILINIFSYTIKIFSLLLILSMFTNIFGFVTLSKLLLNGPVVSIVAFILLTTLVVILKSLFLWFSKTGIARKSNVFARKSEIVLKNIGRIINVIGLFLYLDIVLKAFGLYDIILDGIKTILFSNFELASFSITLSSILVSIFAIWFAIMISRMTKFILENDIYPRVTLPRGLSGTITSLSRYTILTIGFFTAMISVGLNLGEFTLLAGALGVGIGFGLQDLVNNFIAGILLIFERPIQVGDVIELDTLLGTVKQIGIRTSIVRTFDGSDVIIPNGQLISSRLTNWTFSDSQKRININVGVAYGTDINKVIKILTEVATSHKDIFKDPEPAVLFHNFGDSSLDFELRCWTFITSDWLKIRTDIYVDINNRFNEEGIAIPFPQRDIHIIDQDKKSEETKKIV